MSQVDRMNSAKNLDQCPVVGCEESSLISLQCCLFCPGKYCSDHFSPFSHNCPSASQFLLTEGSDNSAYLHVRTYTCSSEECTECGPMKLECCICAKHYCLNHRKHGCIDPFKKKLLAKREKIDAQRRQFETAKAYIDNMVEATLEKHRRLCGSKLTTANKIQLMRLKLRAIGLDSIPLSKRAYFQFFWKDEDSPSFSKKVLYVSRDWALGLVIFDAAEKCNLLMNSRYSNFKNLRLFHLDGHLLTDDLSLVLHELLSNNVLSDGGNVLIDNL